MINKKQEMLKCNNLICNMKTGYHKFKKALKIKIIFFKQALKNKLAITKQKKLGIAIKFLTNLKLN